VRVCPCRAPAVGVGRIGRDTVYVDLDSAEVPIMDGSAGTFIFLLQSGGVRWSNSAAKNFIR